MPRRFTTSMELDETINSQRPEATRRPSIIAKHAGFALFGLGSDADIYRSESLSTATAATDRLEFSSYSMDVPY